MHLTIFLTVFRRFGIGARLLSSTALAQIGRYKDNRWQVRAIEHEAPAGVHVFGS
jgi:hypothetical protein